MVFSVSSPRVGRWHFLERRKSKNRQVPLRRKIFEKKTKMLSWRNLNLQNQNPLIMEEIVSVSVPNQWILAWKIKFPNDVFCFPNIFRRKDTYLYFDFHRYRECHRPTDKLHIEKLSKSSIPTSFLERDSYGLRPTSTDTKCSDGTQVKREGA